jgi:hypothetical protein
MKRSLVIGAVLALSVPLLGTAAVAGPANQALADKTCAPGATAVSFSDGLDKLGYDGATVGGLSDMAWDRRTGAWVSSVDNHASDPSRLWFWRDPADPRVVRDPLVLRKPDGTAYDGTTADNEGLAVLPNGDFLVSSETEPSIRIYGRDGVQKSSLPVPARFAVAPAGEATSNATLEGLTITVTDLATVPSRSILGKKLVADLVQCPTLGAPSRETQANPLLDNYEGMSVTPTSRGDVIHVISDDNFSATQFTRVLALQAWLPNVW